MMKKLTQKIVLACLLFMQFSCNNKTNQNSTSIKDTSNKNEMKVMIPVQNCYSGFLGKDSFFLKTERFPNVVTGTLEYRFFEKDRTKGELEGVMNGDTLIANYTFTSEGVKSVKQVAFILKDSMAIEGFGEMEENVGIMVFKKNAKLRFDKSLKLNKTDCN